MTCKGGHLVFWLLLASGVLADLVSKSWVLGFLQDRPHNQYEIWRGVFRLSQAFNEGGPFSILSGHNYLLVGVTVVAVAVILYLYVGSARQGHWLTLVSLALIASGAVGNLYDRIRFEKVRDFLDFYWINYPVFNLADIFITVGALLLVIELFRRDRRPAEPAKQ